ncbi:MAG: hypothetical protein LBK73_11545 [Treponema sp.]|jgi:hypothetical protein|nr:hypothetical protein [Treponema sp.]
MAPIAALFEKQDVPALCAGVIALNMRGGGGDSVRGVLMGGGCVSLRPSPAAAVRRPRLEHVIDTVFMDD